LNFVYFYKTTGKML